MRRVMMMLAACGTACSGGEQLGRKIASVDGAFVADGMLRVFQVDPLDSAAVARDAFAAYDFSDDGKWLAYVRVSSPGQDTVEIVPATGGQPVSVGDAEPVAWWSPGPARLAFTRSPRQGAPRELWIVSPGEAPVRITAALADHDSHCGDQHAFSPDGTRIAYLEDTDANGELRLVVATPDGNRRELVRPPAGRSLRALLWSTDGTRLAYVVNLRPQDGQTFPEEWSIVDATTGSIVSLGAGSRPSWSPDGTRLFHFASRLAGAGYVQDLHDRAGDGSDDRILESTPEDVDWARWSPAGDRIAFVTGLFVFGAPLRDALFTVAPGSSVVSLPETVAGDSSRNPLISWSRHGEWLVLVRFDSATGKQALLLESPDGATRLSAPAAASGAVRTFGWSDDGRLAYVVSSLPGDSSVEPGGRAFAWAPSASPVQATADGVQIGLLEWTPRGALVGTGSRLVGGEEADTSLLSWPAGRGEAVVVAKSAYSFAAARRHPDRFAAFACR
jgi:dipeptidyl aminopeptidase/acylaminoacyl peptidase